MSFFKISDRVIEVETSANLIVNAKIKTLKKKGFSVVSLCNGEPNFETPKSIINAAKKALYKGVSKYTSVEGKDDLLKSIQFKMKNDLGLSYDKDQIIASIGVKGVLSLAIDSLINPGDEVVLLAPYWGTYLVQVKLACGIPIIVNGKFENRCIPNIEDIKKALSLKTKLIIINSPNNPAGYVLNEDYLNKIMKLIENTSIFVISDEIYESLLFNNLKHISPACLSSNAYNRTLVLIGASKSYAMTGWRVGVGAGPEKLIKAMIKLQGQRYSCITSIAQSAAAFAFYESLPVKNTILNMKKSYYYRYNFLEKFMINLPKVNYCKSQGTFFVLLDFSIWIGKKHRGCELKNDIDLANRLLTEAYVAVIPGSFFGMPNTIRISLSSSLISIKEGLNRIAKWLNS